MVTACLYAPKSRLRREFVQLHSYLLTKYAELVNGTIVITNINQLSTAVAIVLPPFKIVNIYCICTNCLQKLQNHESFQAANEESMPLQLLTNYVNPLLNVSHNCVAI